MRQLSGETRLNPEKRIESLLKFSKRLFSANQTENTLSKYNLKFDQSLVEFTGRRIDDQKVYFGQGKFSMGSEWQMAFKDKPMFICIEMQRWTTIYPRRVEREVEEFIENIRLTGSKMGFRINDPQVIKLEKDNVGEYSRALSRVQDPQMVFCLIPRNQADYYMAIKKECAVERGICSQVVCLRTIGRNQMSVATKVAIQMSAKLGGIPW